MAGSSIAWMRLHHKCCVETIMCQIEYRYTNDVIAVNSLTSTNLRFWLPLLTPRVADLSQFCFEFSFLRAIRTALPLYDNRTKAENEGTSLSGSAEKVMQFDLGGNGPTDQREGDNDTKCLLLTRIQNIKHGSWMTFSDIFLCKFPSNSLLTPLRYILYR